MASGHRWVRLDLDYFSNPKAMAAGVSGRALHLASICWSASQLTDGHVPSDALGLLVWQAGVKARTVDVLTDVGLWEPNGDGYLIHDYTLMQPTRAAVEAQRAAARERARAWRAAHGLE